MGSNGLTSARHDFFANYIASKYPESYDNQIPQNLVYTGNYTVTQKLEEPFYDAGKLVLSPTRTYAPIIKKILKKYRNQINGIIHCSGGAQTKILNFVENLHIVKNNMFEIPLLFELIQHQSETSWQEMYKVFNMGHRMELYVNENIVDDIISISKSFNVDAQIIGYCEKNDAKKLTINSEKGKFEYR
ncbi:phosphoribosylformylglycinamidine cyclo-ligase, partial [Bacteroidales bacterium OttesenSCG-928-I21]|nr:phosphoribosylformylglycinamidine cyclo-ligase [Bacteroidales bacterium OttesenSCG-928-I21]